MIESNSEVILKKLLRRAVELWRIGKIDRAFQQLEVIQLAAQNRAEVLMLKLELYEATGQWRKMISVAHRLTETEPDNPFWKICLANATRHGISIDFAKLILLKALKTHPDDALVNYNLACYLCYENDFEAAKAHLAKAFASDPELESTYVTEPELAPLWNKI
ncbi:MAG TPA: hypothetical protein VKC60_06370 [Opitutaceae bacterium]|nr:hypothetical protein [Opitutaceae bacterium]